MGRASRRQSVADKLRSENDELRDAARQLLAGLTQYARKDNWSQTPSEEPGGKKSVIWIGEGDGPELARRFLGLEEENN